MVKNIFLMAQQTTFLKVCISCAASSHSHNCCSNECTAQTKSYV